MELSIFLNENNIEVSDIGNICLNDIINLIPNMKPPNTNYKSYAPEIRYFLLPKLLINITFKYINVCKKIKQLHRLLKRYVLNKHSYLINLSIYLISIPERIVKDEYKVGRFKGSMGKLLDRYMTPLVIPIIISFIKVINYKIIEKNILKDLDEYRIINLRNNKSEWIKLNKESILDIIIKNIKKYDSIIPIEKNNKIEFPTKFIFNANTELNIDAGNNTFCCDGVYVTIIKDNMDNLWFSASKIAKILGYINTGQAIRNHVKQENKTTLDKIKQYLTSIPSNSQNNAVYINEYGLYSLMIGGDNKAAEKFKNWLTSEVVPSIRKTGSYHT